MRRAGRKFFLLSAFSLALGFLPWRDGRSHEDELAMRHLAGGVQLYRHHQNLFFHRDLPKRREILDWAERQLRAAITLDPRRWGAYFYLGNISFVQNRYGEAIPLFEKVLTLNPDFPEAYNALGIIYYKVGKLDLSRAYFEASLKLHDNPQVKGLLDLVIQLQKRSE